MDRFNLIVAVDVKLQPAKMEENSIKIAHVIVMESLVRMVANCNLIVLVIALIQTLMGLFAIQSSSVQRIT